MNLLPEHNPIDRYIEYLRYLYAHRQDCPLQLQYCDECSRFELVAELLSRPFAAKPNVRSAAA